VCDTTAIGIFIAGAAFAIATAAVMLGVAISQGRSIFTAFQSMSTSVTTAFFIGAAIAALAIAAALTGSGCTAGNCGQTGKDLVAALTGASVAMGTVLALVLVCTFFPGAVGVAGPAALLALIGVAGALGLVAFRCFELAGCFLGSTVVSPGGLQFAGTFAALAALVAGVVAIVGIVMTIESTIEEASG
jgi:hypothetical protein